MQVSVTCHTTLRSNYTQITRFPLFEFGCAAATLRAIPKTSDKVDWLI